MRKIHDYAESSAHALLGEDRNGPYRKEHTSLQRAAAHAVGYAFSPLRYGMEKSSNFIVDRFLGGRNSSGARAPSPTDLKNDRPMPPKGKKMKKYVKKEAKKEVKKAMRMPAIARATVPRNFYKKKFGKNFLRTSGRQQKTRRVSPPTAYGRVGGTGGKFGFFVPSQKFYPSQGACVGMCGKIYLGQAGLNFDSSSNYAICCSLGSSQSGHYASLIPNMPQNSFYFDAPVNTLALLFNRFRMKSRIEYKPDVATSNDGMFRFVYITDPVAYWTTTGRKGDGTPTGQVRQHDTDCYSNVTEGSVFTPWSSKWSYVDKQEDMRFISSYTYSAQLDPSASIPSSDIRGVMDGAWLMSGSGFTKSGTSQFISFGEMWLHYELILCEMNVSKTVTAPTSVLAVVDKHRDHPDLVNILKVHLAGRKEVTRSGMGTLCERKDTMRELVREILQEESKDEDDKCTKSHSRPVSRTSERKL